MPRPALPSPPAAASVLAPSTGHTHPPQHSAAHKVGAAERCETAGLNTRIRAPAEVPRAWLEPSRRLLLNFTRSSRRLARDKLARNSRHLARETRFQRCNQRHAGYALADSSSRNTKQNAPHWLALNTHACVCRADKIAHPDCRLTNYTTAAALSARPAYIIVINWQRRSRGTCLVLAPPQRLIKSNGMRRPRQPMHSHVQTP